MGKGRRRTPVLWRQLLRLPSAAAGGLQSRLRAQLLEAICAGRLPPERALPSSRALAEQLGIARNTVLSVYQQLAEDGYLIAQRRRGYFPNPGGLRARAPTLTAEPAPVAAPNWNAHLRSRPSRQSHIAKEPDWPRYPFPFLYGQVDPALFPLTEWRASCQQVLSASEALDWAHDQLSRDDPLLVEQIRTKVLPLRGIWSDAGEILVTIGAQHALYLLADLLVDSHTEVGLENPGYPDARHIFGRRTARLRPVAVDAQGLPVGPVLAGCRLVYTTPSHQSPTTVTMPVERRLQLLLQAAAEDFLVIEDDYETEVSFSGLPNPALKSLDRGGRVIYVGSLSKSLAPGLRLGYIVAPPVLIAELRPLRRLMIRHPTAFIERSFARFLALGYFDAFGRRLADAYRARAEALTAALVRDLPEVSYPPVTGGSSVWVQGPPWLEARRLAESARTQGVLIEPGDVHFAQPDPPRNFFRLGFSSIAASAIPEGIRRLAPLLQSQRPRR
ncbi:MAG: PLP-dependent aminotransferase family protein [Gammaproteobacteria bacterium]|nr:PLP-dependent aminotransferase family protein [Gammaproteobacteria bacterium]